MGVEKLADPPDNSGKDFRGFNPRDIKTFNLTEKLKIILKFGKDRHWEYYFFDKSDLNNADEIKLNRYWATAPYGRSYNGHDVVVNHRKEIHYKGEHHRVLGYSPKAKLIVAGRRNKERRIIFLTEAQLSGDSRIEELFGTETLNLEGLRKLTNLDGDICLDSISYFFK